MSEVWPFDTKVKNSIVNVDFLRPFKCLLLMPIESRFDEVAKIIHDTIKNVFKDFPLPNIILIERLDWVTSAGIIHSEIWQKIIEADLIFVDITGYNPNVMFELGVASAWKEKNKVAFIKDKYYKMMPLFDIQPSRYIEYELVSEKIPEFTTKISQLVNSALISFPDEQIEAPIITFPLEMNFKENKDDLRIYTPPIAHRSIKNGYFEFGSLYSYPFSWASIGKERVLNLKVQFIAKFGMRRNKKFGGFIGIGLRSAHFYANYAHLVYLNTEGKIVVTQPNEKAPAFYKDIPLRDETDLDFDKDYTFDIKFDGNELLIKIDDFEKSLKVEEMPRVLGAGLIRLQSSGVRMCIKKLRVEKLPT